MYCIVLNRQTRKNMKMLHVCNSYLFGFQTYLLKYMCDT